jgi:hypothetical protein
VRGQRFDAGGNPVGAELFIKAGFANTSSPVVALTSDGRIAVVTGDLTGGSGFDLFTGVYDPRITSIDNASFTSIVGNNTADFLLARDIGGVRNLLAFEINDHAVAATFNVGAVGIDWKIDGAGDFDNDGDGDLLMHRDVGASRTYTVERMGPSGVEAAVPIGTIGSEWQVSGTGDFNNDGDSDILLHRDMGGNRTLLIENMQNNVVLSGDALGAVGTDWQVNGTGDFDNDGDSDIVFHQDSGGGAQPPHL